jgi:hypothetical protein
MKSLLFEELAVRFPNIPPPSLRQLGECSFEPKHIILYFEGWELFEPYGRYIDSSEDRNIVWFETSTYHINEKVVRRPTTLNNFIEDCEAAQVELAWNRALSEKMLTQQVK